MKQKLLLALVFFLAFSNLSLATMTSLIKHNDETTSEILLNFDNAPDEKLFKESLVITADHPEITISKPSSNRELQQWSGKKVNDTQRGWQGPVTLTLQATRPSEKQITTAHLHVSYATNKHPQPYEHIIPLTFLSQSKPTFDESQAAATVQKPEIANKSVTDQSSIKKKSAWFDVSSYIKGLVKSTESPWIRLLLVFLLGILMSLTPCIYPMIPITVGILQSQAGDSTGSNALRALLYTFGMGSTYALFGLLASCTGPLCGYMFSQPIFVIALAALLMYFGLCMFGFIDMYIPRLLQTQRSNHGGGSLLAAFLFGMASGTLASPCVSPGLALILSIVATLGSKLMGFALLFAFGVGLSMPLLIVGLSAGSLHLLPRAGMWMVEIKKLFGFLLFGLSFYYLSAIMPHELLYALIALFLCAMGLYYIHSSCKSVIPFWKKCNAFLGIALVACSIAVAAQAIQAHFFHEQETNHIDIWLTDYQEARERAIREHKLLFIDVWADFCSICITINKTLLKDTRVEEVLSTQFVPLKINGTQPSGEPYATIHKQFTITGFPTYMIVEPETLTVIKRWDSKIYNMDPLLFITKLQKRLR
ncbi:MAG: protein-disulfide reductase DsbD family protein [Candidatus Babeliales bacterium]